MTYIALVKIQDKNGKTLVEKDEIVVIEFIDYQGGIHFIGKKEALNPGLLSEYFFKKQIR